MKRIICFLLVSIFILALVPTSVFAASEETYSGTVILDGNDADTLIIDGKEFVASDSFDFNVLIKVSDSGNALNQIQLNGKKIADMVDGENVVKINTSDLLNGENEIRVVLAAGNKLYDDNTVYGTVNIDDIVVENISFENIGFNSPSSVNYYLPISGEAGTTKKSVDYKPGISVGDGWFADTGLGGSSPNTPVSVGFVFDYSGSNKKFLVDTTLVSDGKHTAKFIKDGKEVSSKEIVIDNGAPTVKFSIESGSRVSKLQKVTFEVSDLTKVKTELTVDGKKAVSINPKKLSYGSHVVIVTATDALGNKSVNTLFFEVSEKLYHVAFGEESLNVSVLGNGKIYSGGLLKDIRMFENRYGELEQDYLRSEDEVLVSFDEKAELVTSSIGNSIPYQSFVVNLDGVEDDEVLVSYSGKTGNGSGIVLKAWNYKTTSWDKIATVNSGESITVPINVETYSFKEKMRINAIPNIVYNGSNTLVWNSDTQYYSRYEDLNEFYYEICKYTVEQYKQGNVGYYVHTGDLVDQTTVGDDIAYAEFEVASKAQKILDDALVPNGVVSGNHDVAHTGENYNYYWKYFNEDRYKDFDWYGGSLNNNMHHYDLISLGSYDFVFLYIGNQKEADEDLIAWANEVCKAYPTRNVVICTHEYLLPSGAYSSENSKVIWDKIIVPNENVKMILCGHNEGVCDQLKQVGDSDRYVLEILADYQFAELGVGPQHVENNCTCDGEGFIRLMTFNDAGQVVSTTYSPVASRYDVDPYNYYPSYSDSFVYDLDMIDADRSICTTSFNVLHNSEEVGTVGESDLSLKGSEAFYVECEYNDIKNISEIFVLNEYEVDYTPDERPEYPDVTGEKIQVTGYDYVSENFRMNESNEFPSDKFIEVGVNLLPSVKNAPFRQTSGTKENNCIVNDNGGVSLTNICKDSNGTWVTMAYDVKHIETEENKNKELNYKVLGNNKISIDLDKYNRIYFGVTATKNAKWNIYVNFVGYELNFSQNKAVAAQFGYVKDAPSDIKGTWNGYIDISDLVQGEKSITSIYLVNATSGEKVDFDYLFIGRSNGGKVRFICDDNKAIAYEGNVGSAIALPGNPFKQGYEFVGWFTEKENGNQVTDSVKVVDGETNVYARFIKKQYTKREVVTSNTEIILERPAIGKIIFVCGSLLIMALVVVVLLIKISKTKKNGSAKKQ